MNVRGRAGHVAGDRVSARGQAVPLVAGLMAVAVVVLVAIGHLGQTAADAARARTAADAAALAGAAEGRDAAVRLASANGATLVAFAADQGAVLVTVRVGRASATARAALMADDHDPAASSPVTAVARL
jgi:hypothetical protein